MAAQRRRRQRRQQLSSVSGGGDGSLADGTVTESGRVARQMQRSLAMTVNLGRVPEGCLRPSPPRSRSAARWIVCQLAKKRAAPGGDPGSERDQFLPGEKRPAYRGDIDTARSRVGRTDGRTEEPDGRRTAAGDLDRNRSRAAAEEHSRATTEEHSRATVQVDEQQGKKALV